ncbi:hypothetical protein P2318_26900 [Myxococcaceae bacterium GXIMD 01537]
MRSLSRSVALAAVLSGTAVLADDYDFRVEQLGNPTPGGANFNAAANAEFQAFARTFGAAITATNLMPPETVGHAAFNVNAELAIVNLPSDTRLPTERTQPGTVLIPALHVRKGLPFSLELGARVGWVEKSRMVAATGEVKWAVNEGFTWLPDLSVRGHVTKLFGNRDFDLTALGLDFGVGKQFPVGGMVTFTPYGGLDFTGISANSTLLDFRQDRLYQDTLATPLAPFEDTGSYKKLSFGGNINQRIYGGVRFIGGALQLGAEVSFARLGSVDVPSATDPSTTESKGVPGVLAFSTSLGLDF